MEIENNIEILLNKKNDLTQIDFLGVKIGDSFEKIKKESITEINAYETRWINTRKGISYRTKNPKTNEIIEILLKQEFLKELSIQTKKDIISKFGEPAEIEKRNDWHYYFYLNRKMVITWREEDKELWGIYIGENRIKLTEFTASDFLTKFYNFKGMVPDESRWNEESLKGNPPRFYRLLELKALMKAFNIGEDLIKDFVSQSFIDNRNPSDFEPIYQDIERYVLRDDFEKKRYEMEKERIRKRGVKMIYQKFVQFSELIRKTLAFNSSWLETGMINSRYIIHKTNDLLKSIDTSKLEEIDKLIVLIIDPKQQSFTKGELIRKYNYPDVDIQKIDMDWY